MKNLETIIEYNKYELAQIQKELDTFQQKEELSVQDTLLMERYNARAKTIKFYLSCLEHDHNKITIKQQASQITVDLNSFDMTKTYLLEELKYLEYEAIKRLGDNYVLDYETTLSDVYNSESFIELDFVRNGSLLLQDVLSRNKQVAYEMNEGLGKEKMQLEAFTQELAIEV